MLDQRPDHGLGRNQRDLDQAAHIERDSHGNQSSPQRQSSRKRQPAHGIFPRVRRRDGTHSVASFHNNARHRESLSRNQQRGDNPNP